MELDLRHHLPCCLPACRLVEKAVEPDQWFAVRPSYWPGQQLGYVLLQIVVSRKANCILRIAFFQGLVELRLGEGGIASEGTLFALRQLPVNLGQQQFLPAIGAVNFAGP